MPNNNKEQGIKAENYLISRLNKLGVPYDFIDDWFDFEIFNQKVEVKSARITVKDTRPKYTGKYKRKQREGYAIGRFDFTKEENRIKQYENNIWICFIIRHNEDFLILGLCRAKELKKKRYITIHKTRDFKLISLDEWIKKNGNK